jgi:hypothetical protein
MLASPTQLPADWPFVPDAQRVRDATDRDVALDRAARVRAGQHQAFRWAWRARPRTETEWLSHPDSGFLYEGSKRWWTVPHFDSAAGDIKDVWEPARFGWAYDLIRGWILTGDDSYVRTLRDGLTTFLRASPPFRGPHWACGQETAIRAIALLWVEGACCEAPSFDDTARAQLVQALAWSAERIADAFGYARSQRNNHGLSEATGLIAIGARLAAMHPRAERWIERGQRSLERMIPDQIAPDGWYIQHSFTYARVALDQLTVARRALRAVGRDLSARSQDRVRALIELTTACVDPACGDLPNHGANDGAYVLPLSTARYRDFRPALSAAAATFDTTLPADVEPDAETLAWLRATWPVRRERKQAPYVQTGSSGWAIATTAGARLFVRAGEYRSRPGHIDPGHIDLWIGGRPAAIDAGTFRYMAPPPWNNGLTAIEVHNTVSIAGLEAARRGPRFLWLSWPRAHIASARVEGDEVVIDIMNDSWRARGITHSRRCTLRPDGAVVIDEIHVNADFVGPVLVHWLLEDGAEVSMTSSSNASETEMRGDPTSTRGWASEAYGVKRPVRSVRLSATVHAGTVRIVSSFGAARGVRPADSVAISDAAVSC